MGDHRGEPETPRPVLIPPSGSLPGDTNEEEGRWYCQAKETKCGGKAGGSLSTAIVPGNPANSTRGEPEEGRAVSGYGAVVGQHGGCIGIQKRANETATDSGTWKRVRDARSESISRGTVCVNRARTGLWGLWEGNLPVLPGMSGALELLVAAIRGGI